MKPKRKVASLFTLSLLLAITASAQTPTINKGIIVVGGNQLAPPFAIALDGDVLRVNGLRIKPAPPSSSIPARVSDDVLARASFTDEIARYEAQAFARGDDINAIRQEVARRYSASNLVASVRTDTGDESIIVNWKTYPFPVTVNIAPPPPPKPDPKQTLKEEAERVRTFLASGGMIVSGQGYYLLVPQVRVQQLLGEMQSIRKHLPATNAERWEAMGLVKDLQHPIPLDTLRR